MISINLNWLVLFIVLSIYIINSWRSKVISNLKLKIIELKQEKEELIDKHKNQKSMYEGLIKNHCDIIETIK